jgi:glucose/arabinose dehydrogenase
VRRTPAVSPRSTLQAGVVSLVLLATAACGGGSGDDSTPRPTRPPVTVPAPSATPSPGGLPAATTAPEVITSGLAIPWGIGFLPNGDALVSERDTARILQVPAEGGPAREVARLTEVVPGGEGGLLGLAISPTYATDRLVFVSYTSATDNRIARLRLGEAPVPIVTGLPKGQIHNGGRLAFGPDGSLYAGTGDAGDSRNAQDPGSLGGKILRMTPEGRPVAGLSSLVFSSGHRNVQGLAFDRQGRLYASELGQNAFDEVNQVSYGDNGGWPDVEGPGTGGGRFAAPIVTWTPDEASPSGAAIVGNVLYVAALRGERLWQVPLDGRGGAGPPVALLEGDWGRLRAVAEAPDGALWVLTNDRPAPQGDVILRLAAGAPADT